MKRGFGWDFRTVADEVGGAAPPDLDAPEQIGLRARHLEHARGIKPRLSAEDLRIGQKAHLRAAPVQGLADDRQPACRLAALERLPIERLPAGDLNLKLFRQRVDYRDADAMESAGGLVSAAVEFAAGVQHGHDHFERGLFGKFRMRIDWHAAAVVHHAQIAALFERNFDESGMPRDRFVHRIVDHFGKQVMQRVRIGAAYIHPRAPADRLEPLEHFDRGGGVVRFVRRPVARARLGIDRRGFATSRRCRAEKIIHVRCHIWRIAGLQVTTARIETKREHFNHGPSWLASWNSRSCRRRWENGALAWSLKGRDCDLSSRAPLTHAMPSGSIGARYARSTRAIPQPKRRYLVPWSGASKRTRLHYPSTQRAFRRPFVTR